MQYVLPVSLFLAAAITVPAQAVIFKAELKLPGVCGPRTELVSALKDEYSEATAVLGMMQGRGGTKTIMEVYVSPTTGSWSIMLTPVAGEALGKACVIASGRGMEFVEPPEDPAT